MPWIKATPRMGGKFEFSMDDISRGKVYKTAEECMDSFSRFEKDASFGPLMTCRPIFFPLYSLISVELSFSGSEGVHTTGINSSEL